MLCRCQIYAAEERSLHSLLSVEMTKWLRSMTERLRYVPDGTVNENISEVLVSMPLLMLAL